MPFSGSELEHVLYNRSRINYSDEHKLLDLHTALVNYVGSASGLVAVTDDCDTIPWWIVKTKHQKMIVDMAAEHYSMKMGLVDMVGRNYARKARLARWREDRLRKKYGKPEELLCPVETFQNNQAT